MALCEEVFLESLVLINYLIKSLQIYYSYLLLREGENLTYCTIKVHFSFARCRILLAKGGSSGVIQTNCLHARLVNISAHNNISFRFGIFRNVCFILTSIA